MLKNIRSILVILISTLFASCSNDPECKKETLLTGDIVRTIDFGHCYNILYQESIVVTSNEELYELIDQIDTAYYDVASDCDTITEEIDFNAYDIVGYFASGTGCNVNFHKSFVADDAKKEYHFEVTVEECGECAIEAFSMNWIIVPKLDTTYTIIYEKAFQ